MRKIVSGLCMVCALLVSGVCSAETVEFHPAAKKLNAILDRLPSDDPDAGFTAHMSRISDGFVGRYALQEQVQLTFSSKADLYQYIAYVDAEGNFSIIGINLGHGVDLIKAGEPVTFTVEGMHTHPPLGMERQYYVATRNPVDMSSFNPTQNTGAGEEGFFYQTEEHIEQAENFVEAVLASNAPEEISTVVIDSHIVPRAEGPRYLAIDIAYFYPMKAMLGFDRSVLKSDIRFGVGSAELTGPVKQSLNEWGKALLQKDMAEIKFEIAGFTDSSETGEYGDALSRQRAQAVYQYLLDNFAIDSARLSVAGYGEADPIAANSDEAGRIQNRRVEFYLRLN